MNKRPRPSDLVKNIKNPVTRGVNWYQRLPDEGQTYIEEVVKELIANPNAAVYLVAEQLITEFNIDRHPNTVARTLKEMVKYGQAKR